MDEELYNYPYHVPVMTQNLVDISQLWHYINKSDIYGLAAEQGQDLVVNYIIDGIVDKNPKIPNQKLTLLHCVAYHGHSKVSQCIVNNILDKNPKVEFFSLMEFQDLHKYRFHILILNMLQIQAVLCLHGSLTTRFSK